MELYTFTIHTHKHYCALLPLSTPTQNILQGFPTVKDLHPSSSPQGEKPLYLLLTVMARNKILPYRPDLKEKARRLRNESTYSEILLWCEIKNRNILGYQFHRQVPMLDYIVDFYCHELMLAIEVDGDSHASPEAKDYDPRRQLRLEAWGVNFLRFDDSRMKCDILVVVEEIKEWIHSNANKQK